MLAHRKVSSPETEIASLFLASRPTMDDREASLRRSLVDGGAADEIVRTLVALAETPGAQQDPHKFILENFGQGLRKPLVSTPAPPESSSASSTSGHASYDILQENLRLKARVAELQAALKDTYAKIRAMIPEGTLTVYNIAAFGVPDVDSAAGSGGSDPFVRVALLDPPQDDDDEVELGRAMDPIAFKEYCDRRKIAAQTSTVMNDVNPSWKDEVLEIVLPAGTPRPPRVLVRIWDDDMKKSDDPIASLEVQLEPLGGSFEKLALKGRSGLPDVMISFEYKMIEVAEGVKSLAQVEVK